jgi:hypothetical protein
MHTKLIQKCLVENYNHILIKHKGILDPIRYKLKSLDLTIKCHYPEINLWLMHNQSS